MPNVCKKPASKPPALAPSYAETSLTSCVCGYGLQKFSDVAALCVDIAGVSDITHGIWRCTNSRCRTYHGCNYRVIGGQHINTCAVSDLTEGVLFLGSGRCFTLRYLRYHENLLFRGFLSTRSAAWSFVDAYGGQDVQKHFDERINDGLFYFLAMQELEQVDMHTKIVIGEELTTAALTKYSKYMHAHVLPPRDPHNVRELVADGHEKVRARCEKSRGASSQGGRCAHSHTNGWFMVVDPASKHIVAVHEQVQPENNATLTDILHSILPIYPSCNALIMDRVCSYAPSAAKDPALSQIKYYIVDKFHALHHVSTCPCNPHKIVRLKRRLSGVNSSACEQLFSWFRGYARVFNEMRRLRHCFLVMYFARRHNTLVDNGDLGHLQKHGARVAKKRRSTPYPCAPRAMKKPAAGRFMSKQRVAMKKVASKKVKTVMKKKKQ